MGFPTPRPGLVIRYSYLWHNESRRGRDEGVKDRPCAVLLAVADVSGKTRVLTLPITHRPPDIQSHGVEIPAATKRRLGLDDARSWIILSEGNRFTGPGPDLRPPKSADAASVAYGELPQALFEAVRVKWLALYASQKIKITARTE